MPVAGCAIGAGVCTLAAVEGVLARFGVWPFGSAVDGPVAVGLLVELAEPGMVAAGVLLALGVVAMLGCAEGPLPCTAGVLLVPTGCSAVGTASAGAVGVAVGATVGVVVPVLAVEASGVCKAQ